MDMKDIIKSRRIELNLTQKEVADYVGVSEATLSRWESGEIKNLRRNRIAALAKILQLPPSTIVGDLDEETPSSSKRPVSDADLRFALFGGADVEITDEMFDEVKRFAAFVAQREKEKKEK